MEGEKVVFKLHQKQKECLSLLQAGQVTEVLYGGGAGGGKSYLGCVWLLLNCVRYPDSRWLMGRTVLKTLKATTLLTLLDIFKQYNIKADVDYTFDKINNVITFKSNGSQIILKDLELYPSDPDFDDLGSTEYTGAFIDEASQLSYKAYNVVKTRLRYKTKEYGLKGQMLMSCNPAKNFLRTEFYSPYKRKELLNYRAFIPALVTDNPYVDGEYIKKLEQTDEATKQRLLYGNWDYENEPNQLILFQWIDEALVELQDSSPNRVIGFDVARDGNDKSVIALREGDSLVDLRKVDIPIIANRTDISGELADVLIQYAQQNGVGWQNVWVDKVGVGGGVVDACRRQGFYVREYVGGGKVEIKEDYSEYRNMRAYSYWQLRKALQNGKLKIKKDLPFLEVLIEELTSQKYSIDESRIWIEKKEEIKERIGRSPDFADAVAMTFTLPAVTPRAVTTNYMKFRVKND
jgi:phage terminase large subunit